jgi:hypothetical protein
MMLASNGVKCDTTILISFLQPKYVTNYVLKHKGTGGPRYMREIETK